MSEPGLRGRKVLVVEDEYLVAAELAYGLEQHGVEVIGPEGSVEAGLARVAREARIDAAVLDINLRGNRVYPIAEALRARGVRFVFATGYDARIIPEAYADVPKLEKPVDTRKLARILGEV